MTIKNIAEKVVGILPGCSVFAYTERQLAKPLKERDSKIKWCSKVTGHVAYAMVFSTYLFSGIIFGVWTPPQYKQAFEQVKARNTQNKIERAQTEVYKQKLFGENGYADKDGEKGISPEERFEVYKKAGLEDKIIFPDLYLKDLERAVKSYESENQ